MRQLVCGPRGSGRTTTLLLTMIEEMALHDDPVYLVVGKYCAGMALRGTLRKYNVDIARIRVVPLESLSRLGGVDAMNIYIEHTAYEEATADELQTLFFHEDRKDIWKL